MTDQKQQEKQESPAMQTFRTYGAMEQAIISLMKENPPDETSLRGAFAAAVLGARRLALKKEDLLSLLAEEWDNWESYTRVKNTVLERRRAQSAKK